MHSMALHTRWVNRSRQMQWTCSRAWERCGSTISHRAGTGGTIQWHSETFRVVLLPLPRQGNQPPAASSGPVGLHACAKEWKLYIPRESLKPPSKLDGIVAYARARIQRNWEWMAQTPPDSFGGRIHGRLARLLDRLPLEETFFRDCGEAYAVYPWSSLAIVIAKQGTINRNAINSSDGNNSSNDMYANRKGKRVIPGLDGSKLEGYVKHYSSALCKSCACLPFSLLLSVLPTPNVFFMWNLFRVYSNYFALQGAKAIQACMEGDRVTLETSVSLESMRTCLDRQDHEGALKHLNQLASDYDGIALKATFERYLLKASDAEC